jgi:hypothetical protein
MQSICITGLGDSEPLVVSPKRACQMLDCSMTRLYELFNSGEIQSYRDGKSRRAIVDSIKAHIARQLEAVATKARGGWTDRATQARGVKKKMQLELTGHSVSNSVPKKVPERRSGARGDRTSQSLK